MRVTGGSPCHFFARSNEPCVDGKKDIRRVLAHERMDFVPDTYGERRDSERPEASKLSARLIASKAVRVWAHLWWYRSPGMKRFGHRRRFYRNVPH